jgi:hypothetical protein
MTDIDALAMTDPEVRAAIGPRADYYLDKWREAGRGGFNWAAFCMSGLWLPYRKMYAAAGILFAVVIAETLLEEAIFVYGLGMPEVPRAVDRLGSLVVCLVCGRFGNRWYLQHVAASVQRARTIALDEPSRILYLSKRGGTSMLAAIAFFTAFVVILVLAVIGFEFLVGVPDEPTSFQSD